MFYMEELIELAERHVKEDGRIPLDVAADLMGLGVDVETLERKWREEAGL